MHLGFVWQIFELIEDSVFTGLFAQENSVIIATIPANNAIALILDIRIKDFFFIYCYSKIGYYFFNHIIRSQLLFENEIINCGIKGAECKLF